MGEVPNASFRTIAERARIFEGRVIVRATVIPTWDLTPTMDWLRRTAVDAVIDTGCSGDGRIPQRLFEFAADRQTSLDRLPRREYTIADGRRIKLPCFQCNLALFPKGGNSDPVVVSLHVGLAVLPEVGASSARAGSPGSLILIGMGALREMQAQFEVSFAGAAAVFSLTGRTSPGW